MRQNETTRARAHLVVGALVTAVVIAACSSGSSSATPASEAKAKTAAAGGAEPRYSKPGPYEVGVTTIDLADRKVEVYYPAKPGSTKGRPTATYNQTDPISPELLATLPKVPDGVDLTVKFPAVRDVPVASDERFPLVLFSHGAGGWRGVYSYPLSGLASWGFVVASTDFAEYGLLAQFTGGGGGNAPDRQTKVAGAANATIDALSAANDTTGNRFRGTIDTKRIGAVGHSAGGGTMFGFLNDPRIGVIVGWAPVPPTPPVTSHTPTMIIAGADDIAITPASATASYETLLAPKRFVEITKMGHNAFSDACLAIRGGTDLIGLAKQLGIGIPDRLLELGRNGCAPTSLDTKLGWRVVQHFTVAELRTALGVDKIPVGLAPGVASAFPGVTIEYRQDLR